jgi:hypothetical protein
LKQKITLESICEPSEDVVAREIEGEIIIVPLVSGIGDADDELYTLNETGKYFWQQLDGEKTLGNVSGLLSAAFSSPKKIIEKDILGFATEMVHRGILAIKN